MKKIPTILFLSLLTLLTSFNSKEINYLPATIDGNQIIAYTQFTLSYNEEHEQADWVAYELTRDEVAMKEDRCNCFKSDKNVITKSASKNDYLNSGFDLGHLSPSADNNMSKKANKESFRMSNISPQLPGFNRGIWKQLEEWVRDQATQRGSVYVITGPVFVNNLGTIGKNKVTIPGYYYKVLLRQEEQKMISIAFLVPHLACNDDIREYVVPINSIETITGIDFFPDLIDSAENKVEAQYQPNSWGL
jgi:endonuclease G|tara:strand:- start:3 stop:746 length:744 start_codon:yes stop_codon:yes gene_type:complete